MGGIVCAVKMKDGTFEYFPMPSGCPDETVVQVAFRLREGKPMGSWEQIMVRMGGEQHAAL